DPPLLITERIGMEEQGQDELSHGIAPVGNPPYTEVAPEPDLEKETVAMGAFSTIWGKIIGCHRNRDGSHYLCTCDPRDSRSCERRE
nr:hypothetical protein [Tanacetum cinerariifolium]